MFVSTHSVRDLNGYEISQGRYELFINCRFSGVTEHVVLSTLQVAQSANQNLGYIDHCSVRIDRCI